MTKKSYDECRTLIDSVMHEIDLCEYTGDRGRKTFLQNFLVGMMAAALAEAKEYDQQGTILALEYALVAPVPTAAQFGWSE